MTTVKTAILLPASLFEQAETLAGEMQISQSFLIEIALKEFIRRRENQQLLEKINAACEVPLWRITSFASQDESISSQAGGRRRVINQGDIFGIEDGIRLVVEPREAE